MHYVGGGAVFGNGTGCLLLFLFPLASGLMMQLWLEGKVGQVRGEVKLALALAACLFVVRMGRRTMVIIGIAMDDECR